MRRAAIRDLPFKHNTRPGYVWIPLTAFDAAVASSKTAAEVQARIEKRFGALQLPIILEIGAGAAFAKR